MENDVSWKDFDNQIENETDEDWDHLKKIANLRHASFENRYH